MDKLYDLINTRYIYQSNTSWLRDLWNKGIREFDIAECKFTPDGVRSLVVLQREGLIVIDSDDPERNKMLTYNQEVIRNSKKLQNSEVPFEFIAKNFDLAKYISNLKADEDHVYGVNHYMSDELNLALFILVTMCRPEVRLNPRLRIVEIYKTASKFFSRIEINRLIKDGVPLSYLYDNSTPTTIIITPEMRMVHPIGESSQTVQEFRSKHYLIPATFGVEACEGEAWDKLFMQQLSVINNYLDKFRRTMARMIKK